MNGLVFFINNGFLSGNRKEKILGASAVLGSSDSEELESNSELSGSSDSLELLDLPLFSELLDFVDAELLDFPDLLSVELLDLGSVLSGSTSGIVNFNCQMDFLPLSETTTT